MKVAILLSLSIPNSLALAQESVKIIPSDSQTCLKDGICTAHKSNVSSNAADSSLDSNNEKKQAKARDVKGYNQRSPHNDNKYYTVMFLELIWVEWCVIAGYIVSHISLSYCIIHYLFTQ